MDGSVRSSGTEKEAQNRAGDNSGKSREGQRKSFEQELNDKTQTSENWKKLNELYGSADGSKFKILTQGYTLEALLAYANRHL